MISIRHISSTIQVDQKVLINYRMFLRDELHAGHAKYDVGSILVKDLKENKYLFESYSLNQKEAATASVYLRAGHDYRFSVQTNCHNVAGELSFQANHYDPEPDRYNYKMAGLRIADIFNFDSDNKQISQKHFTYLRPESGRSSGVMTNEGSMGYFRSNTIVTSQEVTGPGGTPQDGMGILLCENVYTHQFIYSSNPVTGIYSNNLCYQFVQEYDMDITGSTNGMTEYEFKVGADEVFGAGAPIVSREWDRGQLVRKTVYQNSGTLKKVNETIHYHSKMPGYNQRPWALFLTQSMLFRMATVRAVW